MVVAEAMPRLIVDDTFMEIDNSHHIRNSSSSILKIIITTP
jgi:hypothetical protein